MGLAWFDLIHQNLATAGCILRRWLVGVNAEVHPMGHETRCAPSIWLGQWHVGDEKCRAAT